MPGIDPELEAIVQQWFVKCHQDLWMAENALKNPDAPGDMIAFHAQQVVEKCLKGILTFYQIEFPKTHDISVLVELLRPVWKDLPESVESADDLTDFAIMTRYPHELEEISIEEAKKALDSAVSVYNDVIQHLKSKGLTIPE